MGTIGWFLRVHWLAALFALFCFASHSEEPRGIPLKPDPPFAVDGDLGDWAAVPCAISVSAPKQVVWGSGAWTSPQDLSGTVRLAWREESLFVAADVVDDIVSQTQRGNGIWKGDHIEIYVDARPDLDAARDAIGAGQFQIALSPGNFKNTGDSIVDCPAEAFCYRPEGVSTKGVLIASKPTATGWTLEAAIPWSMLGITKPTSGMPLKYEVGISDTDSVEPQQESLMTTSTAKWTLTRSRLLKASLADSAGIAVLDVQGADVFKELRLNRDEKQTTTFAVSAVPEGKEALLSLDARLDTEKVAGFTHALRLVLNGTPITGNRLTNKPQRAKARGGDVYSMAAGERFATYYSPDFTSPDNDPHYGLADNYKAGTFELRVTDLLKAGENVLVIENAASVSVAMIAANARILFRNPPPPPAEKLGPPTGPLEHIEPLAKQETSFSEKELPDSRLEIAVGGEAFVVETDFSTPSGEWVHGSCANFRHERKVIPLPDAIVVQDTLTNLTAENLPVMHRHHAAFGDKLKGLWLAGLAIAATSGSASNASNPTTYAASESCGLGFVALDDIFHVHVTNYAAAGNMGIADHNLVIKPNASCTVEWAVIPTDKPDYWRFINAARRLVGANFTIPGSFAFLRAGPLTKAWTDAQTADFLRFKDAYYACATIDYPQYNGMYPHGTAFQEIAHDEARDAFTLRRSLAPGVKCLFYFHCYIDVLEDGPQLYADSLLLSSDGQQADYGEKAYRLYIPLENNSYGPRISRNVDIILGEMGADGVYWDEHEYSRYGYHYGQPWDGCSADIDPQKMTISRLKSSVTLLTEQWRLALAKRILEKGVLVGNGPPFTRAMAALRFPCFVETGSITNCAQAHLYSPIALGDHLTERSETDAYGVMLAALDYGCVYHWYNDMTVIPTHPHLTRYMYPITPVELHAGYVIGTERIVTKISGLFGWSDASEHEVHVFDDSGREVEGFKAPLATEGGKTYTELRLAEGWSAAIIRERAN